jgi:hypothetical protein
MTATLAAGVPASDPIVNTAVFAVFVAITLFVVYRASSRSSSTWDYYAAGNAFTGRQNGIALSGTFCPRRRSWASPARSRSTATTGSCTRSGSSSRGWSTSS